LSNRFRSKKALNKIIISSRMQCMTSKEEVD
jgi:hypothetical protein